MAVYINKTARPCEWVKLKKYSQLTGDTSSAVHARRHKGQWIDGRHTMLAPDKKIWVNLEEAQKWVKYGNKVK